MTTSESASTTVHEQLSALLDNELPAEELELLIARVGHSTDHKARLARYGLISNALRGDRSVSPRACHKSSALVMHDLAHRVRLALDAGSGSALDESPGDEMRSNGSSAAGPGSGSPVPAGRRRWMPYAAATAAAGLLAVLLAPLMQSVDAPQSTPAVVAVDALADKGLNPALLRMAPRRSPVDLIAATDRASISPQRMTSYLVYHGEFSGMLAAKLTDSHIVTRRTYAVDAPTPRNTTP